MSCLQLSAAQFRAGQLVLFPASTSSSGCPHTHCHGRALFNTLVPSASTAGAQATCNLAADATVSKRLQPVLQHPQSIHDFLQQIPGVAWHTCSPDPASHSTTEQHANGHHRADEAFPGYVAPPNTPYLLTQLPGERHPHARPPHNLNALRTEQLKERRHLQLSVAKDLTRRIMCCQSLSQAMQLYDEHQQALNPIHLTALLTALSRIASSSGRASALTTRPAWDEATEASVSRLGSHTAASTSAPGMRRTISLPAGAEPSQLPQQQQEVTLRSEHAQLRRFVQAQLVPHIGAQLLGFSPRQLSTSLAALARLSCVPPPFWMAEWLQHFGRKLTPHAGAPGGCSATDMSLAMWALAELRRKHAASAARWRGLPQQPRPAPPPAAAPSPPPPSSAPSAFGLHLSQAATALAADAGALAGAPGSAAAAVGSSGVFPGPSQAWLDELSYCLAGQLQLAGPRECANYLWAAAHLQYQPKPDALAKLFEHCRELLRQRPGTAVAAGNGGGSSAGEGFSPRELCCLLWAAAALRYRPRAAVLDAACEQLAAWAGDSSSGSGQAAAAGLGARQLSTCLWSLALLRHTPAEAVMQALARHAVRCLTGEAAAGAAVASRRRASFNTQDITLLLSAMAGMHFRPGPALLLALCRRTAAAMASEACSPSELVAWAVSLSRMQLAVPVWWLKNHLLSLEQHLPGVSPSELVAWMRALSTLQGGAQKRLLPAGASEIAADKADWESERAESVGAAWASAGRVARMAPVQRRLPQMPAFAPANSRAVRTHWARCYMSGRLFRKLRGLSAERMQAMDGELLCSCVWAAAKLRMRVDVRWVRTMLAAVVRLVSARAVGPHALVRLVWAVAALQRRARSEATSACRPAALNRSRVQLLLHRRAVFGADAAGDVGDIEVRGVQGCDVAGQWSRALPARIGARPWSRLVLEALMEHLPSLDNRELVRLTYGLYWLRVRPRSCALVADYVRYVRGRVAASCNGAGEPCDATTGQLLRWVDGWSAGQPVQCRVDWQ